MIDGLGFASVWLEVAGWLNVSVVVCLQGWFGVAGWGAVSAEGLLVFKGVQVCKDGF